MPNWIRKSLVVFVSILTFGLVTPSPSAFYNTSNGDEKKPADESKLPVSSEELTLDTGILDERSERDKVVGKLMEEAEVQSYTKFGSKIKPVIEDEFRIAILPNIEKAINNVTSSFPDEDLSQLTVTEMPSPGTSERIFHIVKENQDVIRFHVRRDRPPQDGYWFNFHYHTFQDNFQNHYALGNIYWDKNTPPKWMS
ncbi:MULTISPECIES: YpjP family protein [Bacillaceae]|uniref:YpjP family protein n=1 Tax=Bacillaceae TaxID=186817 RepID=UPI001E605EB5|nr:MULTISPECIES: YpjP family protein [Bacillaceae]MCE4047298.1 YpjP family protein [Bacillus sp. Au-Bac7]MCM3030577.1 YpjP family protein [Niallia sp. MER 6]MDL0437097.1 YpjP family protein [Niallia sp. SS-2023]UPO86341.1 YpjP family protein [Niallia sp. Man26]